MLKRIKTFGLLVLFTISGFSQTVIKGKVTEMLDGKEQPIPFANIYLLEAETGVATDFDGLYKINVKPGKHTVIISYVGYNADTTVVEVSKNESFILDKTLGQSSEALEAVQVIGKVNRESTAMDIMSTKNAKGLESNMGAQKIAEVGASNVSDATKKIVGLSVVGSKFVFVRGMGDRYNSAYLNGLPIASPDPDKKVIPLNIFPSSVIKSLSVKKGFTPDIYGDFAGGAINIITKNYPESATLNVGFSAGINTQTTFKEYMTYKGGKMDYFGFDDGSRAQPEEAKNINNYNSKIDNIDFFPPKFNPIYKNARPNTGFSLAGGNKLVLNEKNSVGFLVAINHSNSLSTQAGTYKVYNAQADKKVDFAFNKYSTSTTSSVLGNLGWENNDKHVLSYNFVFVNLSNDEARENYGTHVDENSNLYSRRYTFVQNNLMSNQLSGEHKLTEKLLVNWAGSFQNAKSTEPDRKQLVFLYDDYENKEDFIFRSIDVISNHRFFTELSEQELNGKIEGKYVFSQYEKDGEKLDKLAITAGGNIKRKTRDFDYTRYAYNLKDLDAVYPSGVDVNNPDKYLDEVSHDAGAFFLKEEVDPASANHSTLEINAGYASAFYAVNDKFNFNVGARVEDGTQIIEYRDQTQPAFLRKEIITNVDVLPSLVAKYQLNDTNIIRFIASKTISRPGFKEVAPFRYVQFFSGIKTLGEPTLQNGTNYNLDLRYEKYPRFGELIAVGAFYKYLQNPIERVIKFEAGQLLTFQNAQQATVYGVELEINKKLDFITSDSSIFKFLTAGVNVTVLKSQVNFKEEPGVSIIQTNNKRPLQGASPYLINFDLTYQRRFTEDFKGSVSLAYNVFGKRISSAGILGMGDLYEMPVNSLNLLFRGEFKKYEIGLSFKNILNPKYKLQQEINGENYLINSYNSGINIGLSVNYKLF